MSVQSNLRSAFAPAYITALLLAACAAPAATATAFPSASLVSSGQPTASQTDQGNSITLTIWLPPQFDPAGGTAASSILADQLAEYNRQNGQIQIETRIKANEGMGGMLDSLLTAQQAAPLALPDLVLLPTELLPAAAESEIIQPLGNLGDALDSDDWYPFAKQIATWNGETYGLPFLGDALILAYRSTAVAKAPASWQELLAKNNALGFAAGDPQALFAMAQLQATAEITDGDPQIDNDAMIDFFQFLADGQAKEVFPFWLTQYQNNEQIWQAFTEGRVPMTAAWTSQLFASTQTETVGAPLPTNDGQPFTLAKGWAWAIVATNPSHAQAASDLIEFLSEPEFIAQYSAAAGLLPARASSLAAWSPDADQAFASQIITSISAFPGDDILEKWGKALAPSVIAILKQEATPAEAVEAVRISLSESQ